MKQDIVENDIYFWFFIRSLFLMFYTVVISKSSLFLQLPDIWRTVANIGMAAYSTYILFYVFFYVLKNKENSQDDSVARSGSSFYLFMSCLLSACQIAYLALN